METKNFDRLVGLIYDAALEPALWREALDELACQVGADAWHLLGWDAQMGVGKLGVISDPTASHDLDRYNAYYGAVNPHRKVAANSMGADIAYHHRFNERFVSGSEFYQVFFLSTGLFYSLGASLHQGQALEYQIGLLRARGRAPFDSEQIAALARLLPHFDRAFHLMERGQKVGRAEEIAAAGIEATPLAVIAVDRDRRLMHCNRRGEKLLKRENVLRLRAGVLSCADGYLDSRLIAAVEATVKSGQAMSLLLQHSKNACERYSVTLTALPRCGTFSLAGEPEGALCLVAPLDRRRIATARQLVELFGLSSAEARLARAITLGESLDVYAGNNDVRLSTLKTQLRSIFAKTGTDRQSAIVRLIVGIPAVRESG